MVSHRVCEAGRNSPGGLGPRLEAASLRPHQEIRNHEAIKTHSSLSLVSPQCARVRRARGVLLPPNPATPRPAFRIKTSQSRTSVDEEQSARADQMTLDLRHKTQTPPLSQVSKATHFLSTRLTRGQRFPETPPHLAFVSQP